MTLLEKPARLDRSEGDVHPGGNPHIQTDPRNIARVAGPLAARLAELDPANAAYYQARYKAFADRWSAAIANWEKQAAPLKGVPILVQHKAFTYLERLARAATRSPRSSPSPASSRRPRISPKSSRRCSGSR